MEKDFSISIEEVLIRCCKKWKPKTKHERDFFLWNQKENFVKNSKISTFEKGKEL